MSKDTITILGAGYVGLTTAALLSNSGHKVYLVEPDPSRRKAIQEGRSFFYEIGLDHLVEKAVSQSSLLVTESYKDSIPQSKFIFSCVGTPDNPDGSSNLSYVDAAAKETANYIAPGSIYIQKSTVPVGTGQKLLKFFKNNSYVSNPEFLREGTALFDSLFFDRVVVGSSDKKAALKVIDLYKSIEANNKKIANLTKLKPAKYKGDYIATNLNSAELIKVTANAFLALKISFSNSIAKLADQTGADITEVMNGVGADNRIGKSFLNAGRGYGGGCFPKDVSGLISSAKEHGIELPIMTSSANVNASMPEYIVSRAQDSLAGDFSNKTVAVLGLSFKAGTSDTRRSPAIAIANQLVKNGAKVTAYDPKANNEAKSDLDNNVAIKDSTDLAIQNADAVFIATDWPEFTRLDFTKISKNMKGALIVDCMNCLDPSKVSRAGLQYIGVGRS